MLCLIHGVLFRLSRELREDVHAADEEWADLVDLHCAKVVELDINASHSCHWHCSSALSAYQQFVVVEFGKTFSTFGLPRFSEQTSELQTDDGDSGVMGLGDGVLFMHESSCRRASRR